MFASGARIDCKTVRIFAYSSTREQWKAENRERDWGETLKLPYGLARFARIRLLRHALPISLLILRKKPTVLQSRARTVKMFYFVSTWQFPVNKVIKFGPCWEAPYLWLVTYWQFTLSDYFRKWRVEYKNTGSYSRRYFPFSSLSRFSPSPFPLPFLRLPRRHDPWHKWNFRDKLPLPVLRIEHPLIYFIIISLIGIFFSLIFVCFDILWQLATSHAHNNTRDRDANSSRQNDVTCCGFLQGKPQVAPA